MLHIFDKYIENGHIFCVYVVSQIHTRVRTRVSSLEFYVCYVFPLC